MLNIYRLSAFGSPVKEEQWLRYFLNPFFYPLHPSHSQLQLQLQQEQDQDQDQDQEMDLDTFTPDALIERVSWRPAYILDSMISIPTTIKLRLLPRTLAASSIGSLDTLPTEVLHIICNSLDFQSLSRCKRVCHRANALVESLASYNLIMKHASTALIALGRTKLITSHTAATLHAAFVSDRCVTCQQYAAFLFLPTCERCCYYCLERERSLRVITIPMARICFGLSQLDLGQIPNMCTLPGRYAVRHILQHRKRVKLISVKQAERLGIAIHGSREAMESAGISRDATKVKYMRNSQLRLYQWLVGSDHAEIQLTNSVAWRRSVFHLSGPKAISKMDYGVSDVESIRRYMTVPQYWMVMHSCVWRWSIGQDRGLNSSSISRIAKG